jgi:hypothetical protein
MRGAAGDHKSGAKKGMAVTGYSYRRQAGGVAGSNGKAVLTGQNMPVIQSQAVRIPPTYPGRTTVRVQSSPAVKHGPHAHAMGVHTHTKQISSALTSREPAPHGDCRPPFRRTFGDLRSSSTVAKNPAHPTPPLPSGGGAVTRPGMNERTSGRGKWTGGRSGLALF